MARSAQCQHCLISAIWPRPGQVVAEVNQSAHASFIAKTREYIDSASLHFPLRTVQVDKVVQCCRHIRMRCAVHLLSDGPRPRVQWLCLDVLRLRMVWYSAARLFRVAVTDGCDAPSTCSLMASAFVYSCSASPCFPCVLYSSARLFSAPSPLMDAMRRALARQ